MSRSSNFGGLIEPCGSQAKGLDCASNQLDGGYRGSSIPHLLGVLPVLKDSSSICMDFTSARAVRIPEGYVSRGKDLLQGTLIGRDFAHPYHETRRLYKTLLNLSAGLKIYRIWHYLPMINGMTGGLENYRHFCTARSEILRETFGQSMEENLAAASAVGSQGPQLIIHFLAGYQEAQSYENPDQVPAYKYPIRYSPKPPAFVRAIKIDLMNNPLWFISGTASICGSESCHVGNIKAQTELTVKNLKIMASVMGLKDMWENGFATVYIRHVHHLECICEILRKSQLIREDHLLCLQAAICREELDIEIEINRIAFPKSP